MNTLKKENFLLIIFLLFIIFYETNSGSYQFNNSGGLYLLIEKNKIIEFFEMVLNFFEPMVVLLVATSAWITGVVVNRLWPPKQDTLDEKIMFIWIYGSLVVMLLTGAYVTYFTYNDWVNYCKIQEGENILRMAENVLGQHRSKSTHLLNLLYDSNRTDLDNFRTVYAPRGPTYSKLLNETKFMFLEKGRIKSFLVDMKSLHEYHRLANLKESWGFFNLHWTNYQNGYNELISLVDDPDRLWDPNNFPSARMARMTSATRAVELLSSVMDDASTGSSDINDL